jgi:predicted DNA-binding protein (MmcQ/YjbR family)
MIKNKDIIYNTDTGLPISDIHLNYPDIHKQFLLNPGCIGAYKAEWDTYVYTVEKKVVSILSHNDKINADILNLKLRVEDNMELRDMYPDVIIPGYHMNKIHWSSIILDKKDKLPQGMLNNLIDDSYFLVFSKLPKRTQLMIKNEKGKNND